MEWLHKSVHIWQVTMVQTVTDISYVANFCNEKSNIHSQGGQYQTSILAFLETRDT